MLIAPWPRRSPNGVRASGAIRAQHRGRCRPRVATLREERRAQTVREVRRGDRRLGREGERPEGPFGPLPVSELAMLIGFIALVIGFLNGGGPVVIVGLVVCGAGGGGGDRP